MPELWNKMFKNLDCTIEMILFANLYRIEITHFSLSCRYEVCKSTEDGAECVTLSVYFREKKARQSSATPGTVLYGQPLLIAIPKHKLTLDYLYSVILERIRWVVQDPDLRGGSIKNWWYKGAKFQISAWSKRNLLNGTYSSCILASALLYDTQRNNVESLLFTFMYFVSSKEIVDMFIALPPLS